MDYIKSSEKYNKLLQLNTRRSRLATNSQLQAVKKTIGEVKVKHVEEIETHNVVYEAVCSKVDVKGWKPEPREGQVCIVFKDYLFLLGGHNNFPLENICVYSFKENAWVRSSKT